MSKSQPARRLPSLARRTEIPLEQLALQPFHVWNTRWFLLAAGEYHPAAGAPGDRGAGGGHPTFNFMTVSWGGLGYLWNKPLALVVVRPTRYTRGFIDQAPSFTLSVLPESYRRALNYAGSHSGREGDKARASGLTPEPSQRVTAPSFQEAELVLECRKSYFTDLDPEHFLDPSIQTHYSARDYHRVYLGEVLGAFGTAAWEPQTATGGRAAARGAL